MLNQCYPILKLTVKLQLSRQCGIGKGIYTQINGRERPKPDPYK